jgi:hypothetical protein
MLGDLIDMEKKFWTNDPEFYEGRLEAPLERRRSEPPTT